MTLTVSPPSWSQGEAGSTGGTRFRDASICRNRLPSSYAERFPIPTNDMPVEKAALMALEADIHAWQLYFIGECVAARNLASLAIRITIDVQIRDFGVVFARDYSIASSRYVISLTQVPRVRYTCAGDVRGPGSYRGFLGEFSCPIDDWLYRRDKTGLCAHINDPRYWPTKTFPADLKRYFGLDPVSCPKSSRLP